MGDYRAAFLRNAGTTGMRTFSDRLVALVPALLLAFVLSLGLLAAGATEGRAGPYEDAIQRFTADGFSDTIEGVNGVVASGNPLAAAVVGALQEGRLLFSTKDKSVFVREGSGRLIDAATGQPIAG